MPTISQLVEDLIGQKPFVQEGLSRGIINHAALAEDFIPVLEKQLKRKIKFSAVNMAIRRLSEKLKETFATLPHFDATSDIVIQSNLFEITLYKTDDVDDFLKRIYKIVDIKEGDVLTVTQGLHEVMIITNARHQKSILSFVPKKAIKKIIRNVSSLTINLPPTGVETVGLFYLVTRALTWENINIVDIISTFTELTFIIDEEDVPRAFDTLRKVVRNS